MTPNVIGYFNYLNNMNPMMLSTIDLPSIEASIFLNFFRKLFLRFFEFCGDVSEF